MDNEYLIFRNENEPKFIKINEFSWYGTGCFLENIFINLYKHRNIKKSTVQKNEFDYIIEIKCKGCKCFKKFIPKDIFENIFENIYELDFEKLYEENSSGCDGSEFILEITKAFEFTKISKKIELWSPHIYEDNIEINKLLKIYDKIKNIVEYDNYCKNIENYKIKRKLL